MQLRTCTAKFQRMLNNRTYVKVDFGCPGELSGSGIVRVWSMIFCKVLLTGAKYNATARSYSTTTIPLWFKCAKFIGKILENFSAGNRKLAVSLSAK